MNIVFIFLRLEHWAWLDLQAKHHDFNALRASAILCCTLIPTRSDCACVIFVFSVGLHAKHLLYHYTWSESLPCSTHPYSGHIITSPGKRISLKHLCLWTKLKYLPLWTTSTPVFPSCLFLNNLGMCSVFIDVTTRRWSTQYKLKGSVHIYCTDAVMQPRCGVSERASW